jgi:hypothetical protein
MSDALAIADAILPKARSEKDQPVYPDQRGEILNVFGVKKDRN